MKINLFFLILLQSSLTNAAEIQFLPWDHDIASQKIAVAFADKTVPLEELALHPSKRSRPIQVPSESDNLRLISLTQKNEQGTPLATPIKIGEQVKQPLAILVPDKKAPLGLRALVIDDNFSDFNWGTIRLLNITKKELLFRWEDQGRVLKPGWKPTNISPGGQRRNMEVLLHTEESGKEPIYSSIWEHRDDMRKLVFVFPSIDRSRGPIEFKIIPERLVANADS